MGRLIGAICTCFLIAGCEPQPQQASAQPAQPRYQATALDGNHALLIDQTNGDIWYWIDAPIGVRLRYMGKLKPGSTPGEIIAQFRLTLE